VTKKDFLGKFEEVLEAGPGTITGHEALIDLDGWDSLATMSFIAMVDESFGESLSPSEIAKATTVDELVGLFGDKIEG